MDPTEEHVPDDESKPVRRAKKHPRRRWKPLPKRVQYTPNTYEPLGWLVWLPLVIFLLVFCALAYIASQDLTPNYRYRQQAPNYYQDRYR